MKITSPHEFSPEQKVIARKALVVEWITVAYLCSVIVLMYVVMGSSQAMKTAWVEDILGIIPPMMFIVTTHFRKEKASAHYPYGFHRVVSFGFFVSAIALLWMGSYLFGDSVTKLVEQEHPTIGMKEFFGRDLWLGWWMLAVLVWATIPPVILGHHKKKLAKPIHNKILYTDANMNKADWTTAVAAGVGVIGIGYGLWWLDSLAAIFVSLSIVGDGWRGTKDGFTELMNSSPKDLDGNFTDLPERAEKELLTIDGIERAQVRMYDHGHIVYADVFLKIRDGCADIPACVKTAQKRTKDLNWRVHEVTVTINQDL